MRNLYRYRNHHNLCAVREGSKDTGEVQKSAKVTIDN